MGYIMANNIIFKDSSLINSPVVTGKKNTIYNNKEIEIEWKKLQDGLEKVCRELPKESDAYAASDAALKCVIQKDKSNFLKTLENNKGVFLSDVFKGVASGLLVEMLNNIISACL